MPGIPGLVVVSASFVAAVSAADEPSPLVLNDDAGWCWFQDERAILEGHLLVVGSVANGRADPSRRGDVELTIFNLTTNQVQRVELHDRLRADGHNNPALLICPDGRWLVVYAAHNQSNRFWVRRSTRPGDPTAFDPAFAVVLSRSTRVTYANLFQLENEDGRIWNFFRGLDGSFKPSYALSDDGGQSWSAGNVVIDVPARFRRRPYVKYVSDGRSTIHLFSTEGHPRDYENSLYHTVYRDRWLHRDSDDDPLIGRQPSADRSLRSRSRWSRDSPALAAGNLSHLPRL